MNIKTTIFLLVALIAIGVTALFVERSQDQQKEAPPVAEKKLLGIESKDVSKITLTSADGKKLVVQKTGTDWRMLEPVNAPADTFAVDSLLRGLVDLKSRGQVDLGGDNASVTGLKEPRYVAELQAGDNKSTKLSIGTRQEIGNTLYVQLAGNAKADVVGGDVCEQLDKAFTSYRQTKLVNTPSTDIKQISIAKPDGKIILEKTGDNWQMVQPEKMPVESSEASDLTFAITGLNASEFVTPTDVTPSDLLPSQKPRCTVWFSTQAPTTQPTTAPASQPVGTTVTFGGYDTVLKKNVYVAVSNPPALAKVSASSLDSFNNKKPLDLRDRKVVDVDPAQVTRVSVTTDKPATTQPTTRPASKTDLIIERKKQDLVLGPIVPATKPGATQPTTQVASTQASTQPATQPALPPSDWTLKSAANADASQSTVQTLLEKFHPLRADKYLAAAPAGETVNAVYTVEILAESPSGKTTRTLKLTDRGADKPLLGEYNGLTFETPHTLIESLTADFANKPEASKPPAAPEMPSFPQ
jgi:hypothetical protein